MKTLLLWTFTLLSHISFAQELSQTQKKEIDSLFNIWTDAEKPGVAVAVVIGDTPVYTATFGSAVTSSHDPLQAHTNFWVASVSKQFTALGVSTLEQAGKLSVDEPVSKYIPELRQFSQVTISHLLHHRSGLRDGYTLVGMTLRGEKHYDPQSVLTMLSHQKDVNFPPGTGFEYVNSNYVLLALIIERVSGKPFHEFMKTEVFEPLGLMQARVYNGHTMPGDAVGYHQTNGKYKPINRFLPAVGSSGVMLSLQDAIAFERAYHKLPRPYVLDAMEKTDTRLNDTATYRRGVEIHRVGDHTVVRHFGSDPGFRADILRLPEQKMSVILFSNANNYWSLEKDLFYIAGVALNDTTLKSFGSPAVDHPAAKEAEALAGVYRDTTVNSLRFVKFQNGFLKVSSSLNGYYKSLKSVGGNKFSTQETYEFFYTFGNNSLTVTDVSGEHRFMKIDSTSFSKEVRHYKGRYHSEELSKKYRITYKNGHLRLTFFRVFHVNLHTIGSGLFYGSFGGDDILQFASDIDGRPAMFLSRDGIRKLKFRKVRN